MQVQTELQPVTCKFSCGFADREKKKITQWGLSVLKVGPACGVAQLAGPSSITEMGPLRALRYFLFGGVLSFSRSAKARRDGRGMSKAKKLPIRSRSAPKNRHSSLLNALGEGLAGDTERRTRPRPPRGLRSCREGQVFRLGGGNQWNGAGPRENASDRREKNGAMRGGAQGHLRPD